MDTDLTPLLRKINCEKLLKIDDLIGFINDSEINYSKQLILPQGEVFEAFGEHLWGICALILSLIRFEKVLPNFELLLEWYQDLNWPGIKTITDMIKYHKSEIDIKIIEDTIRKAKDENDIEWLFGLKYLLEQLDFYNDKYISKEILEILNCLNE